MEDHSRIIIHIDIDCFYAQVEMNKDPKLMSVPLGVQQKNMVVTSNYLARGFGIKKCMAISEARNLCPDLVLVNGENLHDYREISYKITKLLHKYTELVERLGLDENYVDVTNLVNERLKTSRFRQVNGIVFGDQEVKCDCGCADRLCEGSEIAANMRQLIFDEFKLTTCAGIAHNKLLAKVAGTRNKPNKQTIVFQNNGPELMLSLQLAKCIPSIGKATADELLKLNIVTVAELQNSSIEQLAKLFGVAKAKLLRNISFGIDETPVKISGKPQSISLEDSCKPLTAENEIENKLKELLQRLMILVKEDGRVPRTIKLVVRKLDNKNQNSVRESRQCNINTSLFKNLELTDKNKDKLMVIIRTLFRKVVDVKNAFRITLLGLSFTKFMGQPSLKNTLQNYLINDIEVQSIIDVENKSSPKATISSTYDYASSSSPEQPAKKCKTTGEYSDSPVKLELSTLKINSPKALPVSPSAYINCPPGIDEEVFKSLPDYLQDELRENYRIENKEKTQRFGRLNKKCKVNSILNYVTREKRE